MDPKCIENIGKDSGGDTTPGEDETEETDGVGSTHGEN